MTAQPTVLETASRLWNSLPSLWKALIPALGALVVVLLPANLLISSRFYAITTDNLRTEHQALLADIGNAFDDLFAKQTTYLTTLANSDPIKACAAQGCTSTDLFAAELQSKLHEPDVYYTEIGFIDLNGKEMTRAMRGPGNTVAVPGDSPMLSTDPAQLSHTDAGQIYVFPVSRDPRISAVDAYQQPVLRLAMPVVVGDTRQGYVTVVLNLDDFFAQQFVYTDQQQVFLLDTNHCLLASSDETRRAELYETWSGAPDRTCYTDLSLEDWDTTVQHYHDTILSTHVMHGPLSSSGQTWTLVVQQPVALAYGQADTLRNLLAGSQVAVIVLVALLIGGADRATARLLRAAHSRSVEHARDIRFNPYVVGTPVEDRQMFFGRTEALARVIGAGVMGGDDVLIDGDRRIGKTSLLRQVERRLRERRVSDPNYWYWPVAFSLQGVPADMFYRTLIDHILRDAEEHAVPLNLRSRGAGAYGVEDFREDIARILDLPNPEGAGRQTRIVLCLDNVYLWFGGVSSYDRRFIDTFRNMLSGVGNQLKLVAAGTHVPAGAFGQAVTVVTLGPLSVSEAERLIRQPVADYYAFSDEAVERIMRDSDRLPMELQRLARHAVQIMLEQDAESITAAQAEHALQRALADWEPTYRLLWNGGVDKAGATIERFSDELRAALLDLAQCDDPVPPALWSGNKPLIARSQLDDIAYTDYAGAIRLMTVFKAWLAL